MNRKTASTSRTGIAFHFYFLSPVVPLPRSKPNSGSIKASAFSTSIPRLLCILQKNHTLLMGWECNKFMVLKIAWKIVFKIAWKVPSVFLVDSITHF